MFTHYWLYDADGISLADYKPLPDTGLSGLLGELHERAGKDSGLAVEPSHVDANGIMQMQFVITVKGEPFFTCILSTSKGYTYAG